MLNDDGSIAIDPYFETSRQGIFAVGDVHGDIKLIAVAWAEGIQAAIHAFKEITSPYWLERKTTEGSQDCADRRENRPRRGSSSSSGLEVLTIPRGTMFITLHPHHRHTWCIRSGGVSPG